MASHEADLQSKLNKARAEITRLRELLDRQRKNTMEEENGDWDLIATPEQGPIKTHGRNSCQGRPCCIHDPSDHHMRTWPMIFDPKKLYLANRVCEHGDVHPDPDSADYFLHAPGINMNTVAWIMLHQCDGCCLSDPSKDIPEPFGIGPVG